MSDAASPAPGRGEGAHSSTVRQEFARQAPTFAQDDSFFASEALSRWILRTVSLEGIDVALEVACGASHFGEVIAKQVRQVVGIDLTPEMLATGQARLAERGVGNVLLQTGDVTELPFLDGSFDLVFCRFAVHHFDRPERAIAEMVRVCRPGGRVAIVDMVSRPELNERFNTMERRRDPSHTRALAVEELQGMLAANGASVITTTDREVPMHVDRWLAQALTPNAEADAIRAELRADLGGGPATGMRPLEKDGDLHFLQDWHIAVARKGA